MSQMLVDWLRTHDEAFRSRARLASLYSDFRSQRNTNPDGYQANTSAWLRAFTAAAKEGLIPSQPGTEHDTFVLRAGEELSRALQTQEFGRPLALGAAIEDAARKKELIQLDEFLSAKRSIYTKSWVPTPRQVLSWGLRQLGVMNEDAAEDKLVAGNFVIMANVEVASKALLEQASRIATSNTSRIFSKELFASTFSSAFGMKSISSRDLSVLLTHLSRDKSAISYSSSTDTVKFKAPSEVEPSPITSEDTSIASLRTLISSLEPQIEQLTSRVAELDKKSRDAVASKQLTTAKAALRSKKLADTKLQQRAATLSQLEEVYAKIEQAADQVEMVKVMEASAQTLKSLNKQTGGVERVQDVVDGLKEEMMSADEIGQTLNEASAGVVDEGEVDDELEALEKAEKAKQDELERREREKREEDEAERTKKRLQELDQISEKEKTDETEAEATERLVEADADTNRVEPTASTS